MRYRDEHGDDRFYDLDFRDFMADPIDSVRRIYDRFGQPFTAETERALRAWHDDHPQGKHGRHGYEKQDIGVSEGEILERFGEYMRRYGLSEEIQ